MYLPLIPLLFQVYFIENRFLLHTIYSLVVVADGDIGQNTFILSLADSYVLSPLTYHAPSLFQLATANQNLEKINEK